MNALYKKRFMIAALLLVFIIAIRVSGVSRFISFETFNQYKDQLKEFVDNNYCTSIMAYIGLYILVTALTIPVAAFLTIIGGFLFGAWFGALYANISAVIGGTIAFLTVRYLLGSYLQERYGARLVGFNKHIKEDGAYYLLMLQLLTLLPFFVVNVLAALTEISLFTFVWTLAVGIIPGSLVYTFAGQQLATVKSVGDIFSGRMIAAFVLLGLIALLPLLIKKWRKKSAA